MKPILCLDFDGVIHSYTSPWKSARLIPDAPVPGAFEFICTALKTYDVAILSSRSHHFGGRRAMKRWMMSHLIALGETYETCPEWWRDRISSTAFADPWDDEVHWAATRLIREIRWPIFKPPAMVTIDDRALTFTGTWPDIAAINTFKPWNKKGARK